MAAYLARIGLTVFAMLFAIALVTEQQAAGRALVATPNVSAVPAIDGPVAVAGFQAVPPQAESVTPSVVAAPAVPAIAVPAPAAAPAGAVPAPAAPVAPAAVNADGIVLASWYGPGFYGNRTACGQIYTPEILGVAHKTLPCGTVLTLTYGSRVLTAPVIDRGPYIAGRTLDLSNATKLAIGCTDLCTVRMQIGR